MGVPNNELQSQLHSLTNKLVNELISLAPESMSLIQFELVATEDGGADIGLIENHPDVVQVSLSDTIYDAASKYLPLIKQYIPGWKRTLLNLQESGDSWEVRVDFEQE